MTIKKRPHVVILGAGLGGCIAAFEVRETLGSDVEITVVNKGDTFHFVPSNPWVGVSWRTRDAIEVKLAPVFAKRRIRFDSGGAKRVHPDRSEVELSDGSALSYDYLVIATGPDLAFDEIEGLGPHGGFTQSVCHVDHAEDTARAFEELVKAPGPIVVGAVQGASCFGPAYEFAMILDTELRRRQVRDRVPMTFVTSEPYIGHLGLDGVGDTKGLLESEMRQRHIKWITNAKVARVEPGVMHVDGLNNPRGFILVDKHQRNPTFPNVFALGVCVAIAPTGKTAVPVGVPKTGFMIESMVTAIAQNLKQIIAGTAPTHEASWNAICLADFGDGGVCFIAQPQIPPRNVNWSAHGGWVHLAKIGFEKYFLGKIKQGVSEPFYEKMALELIGVHKLKSSS